MATTQEKFNTWYNTAKDSTNETLKSTATFLKTNFVQVENYLDIDQDGNLSVNDGYKAVDSLASNLKTGLADAQEALGDPAGTLGKIGGFFADLWKQATSNPVVGVLGAAGMIGGGILFGGEMGVLGWLLAGGMGIATAWMGTQLTKHDDHAPEVPTAGDRAHQASAARSPEITPAMVSTARQAGQNPNISPASHAAEVIPPPTGTVPGQGQQLS